MPYTINGNAAPISEEPRIVQGRHYVPLTEVVEYLGGRTTWDNVNKIATATIGQWTATIRMADRNIDVSGTPVTLQSDPFVEGDVMYVPATFFKDAFGYNVEVDPSTHAVSIALP